MFKFDGARFRDLSVGGWIGVGAVVFGLLVIGTGLFALLGDLMWDSGYMDSLGKVAIGAGMMLIGGQAAYQNATAELEGNCDNCGTHIRTHSGRDRTDEVVRVEASGTPRRGRIGPFRFVIQRQRQDNIYCSGECADQDVRMFIGTKTAEDAPTAEVAD